MLFPVTMIVTNSFKHFPESKYQNLQKVLFRHCSIGNHRMLQQQQQLSINSRSRRGLEGAAEAELGADSKHDTRPEAGNENGVWSVIVCDRGGKTVMYVTLL